VPILVMLAAAVIAYYLQKWLYRKYWNHNLSVEVRFEHAQAFEGERLHLLETVINRKLLPLPWLAVKLHMSHHLAFGDEANAVVSDYYYRHDMYSVLLFQRIDRRIPFTCGRRGYFRIRSIDLISNDVLGASKLVDNCACRTDLTVFPAPVDMSEMELEMKRVMGNVIAQRFINPDPFEFRGIREYAPTDSIKTVNFKASAKTGMLMTNMYAPTVSRELCVLLHLKQNTDWIGDGVLEKSISLAGTIAARFIGEGVPVSLYCNGADIITDEGIDVHSGSGERHLDMLYTALARIDLNLPVRNMCDCIAEQARRGGDNTIFVLISAFDEDDLRDAYADLRLTAFDTLWIVPTIKYLSWNEQNARPDEERFNEHIIKWEVER